MKSKLSKLGILLARVAAVAVTCYAAPVASAASSLFSCKECIIETKVASTNWGKCGYLSCDPSSPRKVFLSLVIESEFALSINGSSAEGSFYRTRDWDPDTAHRPESPNSCPLWYAEVAAENEGDASCSDCVEGGCSSHYSWPNESADDSIMWNMWSNPECGLNPV